jgi:hypothetical protein
LLYKRYKGNSRAWKCVIYIAPKSLHCHYCARFPLCNIHVTIRRLNPTIKTEGGSSCE